jgi:hypothetical protein
METGRSDGSRSQETQVVPRSSRESREYPGQYQVGCHLLPSGVLLSGKSVQKPNRWLVRATHHIRPVLKVNRYNNVVVRQRLNIFIMYLSEFQFFTATHITLCTINVSSMVRNATGKQSSCYTQLLSVISFKCVKLGLNIHITAKFL